jgi:hypothetical protein
MSGLSCPDPMQFRLDALQSELADLAYDLELRGRLEAADVAMMVRARLREITAAPGRENQPDDAKLISL